MLFEPQLLDYLRRSLFATHDCNVKVHTTGNWETRQVQIRIVPSTTMSCSGAASNWLQFFLTVLRKSMSPLMSAHAQLVSWRSHGEADPAWRLTSSEALSSCNGGHVDLHVDEGFLVRSAAWIKSGLKDMTEFCINLSRAECSNEHRERTWVENGLKEWT